MNEKKPTSKKLKVLQLLPALSSGGVEQCVVNICRFFAEQPDIVLQVASSGGQMLPLLPPTITHHQLELEHKTAKNLLQSTAALAELIEREQFNIIHVHSRFPAWVLRFAMAKCSHQAKIISTIHAPFNSYNPIKNCYNHQLAHADKVITVSKYMQDFLVRDWRLNTRPQLIYHGIDIEQLANDNHQLPPSLKSVVNSKFILLPGRIAPKKGHQLFLKAMSQLLNKTNYKILFIGKTQSTKYRDQLFELAMKCGLDKNLTIHDPIDHLGKLYRQAALVVVPSTKPEAFGMVTAEAMSCGALVLTSDHGAAREIIDDNQNGYYVQPKVDMFSKKNRILFKLT